MKFRAGPGLILERVALIDTCGKGHSRRAAPERVVS